MSFPGTSSNFETDASVATNLPLFRPEVIAAQRQRFYGDVILIRPFSFTLLAVSAIFLGPIVFGFIVCSHYTLVTHVDGVLAATNHLHDQELLANLYVPAQAIPFLRPGKNLIVQCLSCATNRQWGIVRNISATPPTSRFKDG